MAGAAQVPARTLIGTGQRWCVPGGTSIAVEALSPKGFGRIWMAVTPDSTATTHVLDDGTPNSEQALPRRDGYPLYTICLEHYEPVRTAELPEELCALHAR